MLNSCVRLSIVARTGWYLGDLSVSLGPHSWTSIRRSSDTAVAAADAVVTGEPAAYARKLYAALRELDSAHCEMILIEAPPEAPEWAGVRDRLMRATG